MGDLGHYDNHPAYRFQVLYVAKKMKFGRDRSNVPNIEIEAGRGGPWFTGDSLGPVSLFEDGVNPAGIIFEPLTDDVFGLGLAESDLHQGSFNDTRVALSTSGFRMAVRQTDATDIRTFLASVLEYFDGFLVRRADKIGLGYWTTGAIDTAVLPVIGSTDLYSEQRFTPTGWDDCITECNVVFRDRTQYYHDTPSIVRNAGLQQILGEYRPVYLQRPFIIDPDAANLYATQYLQRYARPGATCEIDVKLETIENIENTTGSIANPKPIVGQLIKLDLASLGEEMVFRVTDCEYPADEGPFFCTLTLDLERSIWPVIFVQPPPEQIGNFVVDLPRVVNRRVVELPSGLKTNAALQITILAQRPAKSIVGFHVWRSADDITFMLNDPPCTFAVYGRLTATYIGTTADVDQTVGMEFSLFGVDGPLDSTNHILDYTVLCFVQSEIMSVGRLTALGGGVYRTYMYRARYGTAKVSHVVGTNCYFVMRENIVRLQNKSWDAGVTQYFKLQPYDQRQDFDLAGEPSFAYTFLGGALEPPPAPTLTTAYTITSEKVIDSRITATWTYPDDLDVSSFNVSYRKATWDSIWVTLNNGAVMTWKSPTLDPNQSYQVRVQAVNAVGELSAWSVISTITTAAPNVPNAPTGFSLIAIVGGCQLSWTNDTTTPGIRGTQILFSEVLGDDVHLNVIDEVSLGKNTYIKTFEGSGTYVSFLFWAVRHVSRLNVSGARTTSLAAIPLTDSPATRVATPLIVQGATGSGTLGTANFRVMVVDQQSNSDALFISINDAAYISYSTTGNYSTGGTGTVMPATNNGEISCSVGAKIVAYGTKVGFLQSAYSQPFFNNATNAPNRSGGGTGTPVAKLP